MNGKFKLTKTDALIYISIIVCFKIDILSFYSRTITFIYLLMQLGCIIVFCGEILYKRKLQKIDYFTGLFCLIGLVSTAYNHLSFSVWIQEMIRFLALVYSARYGFSHNAKAYIQGVAKYLGILTITNTIIAVIIYPSPLIFDGLNPIFMLGGDNTSVRLYILALMFSVLAIRNDREGKCYTFIIWLSFCIFVFVRDLGTGKVCLFVLTITILIFLKTNISMPKWIIKFIGLLNIVIFLMLMGGGYNLFRYIIVELLNRDMSMTTRTTIWQITIEKVLEKPILGNGYVTGQQFESMLPYIIGVNAHNTLLMLVYMGGILLLCCFVFIFLAAQKTYDKSIHKQLCGIIPIAFLAMSLRAQVEGGDAAYLIYFCHMMVVIGEIEMEIERGIGKKIAIKW